jgi:uncharacterized membrane protein YphA (DoxX/SURF4 family)
MFIAHVKWFSESTQGQTEPLTGYEWFAVGLLLIGAVLIMRLVHKWIESHFSPDIDKRFGKYWIYVTPLVRIVTGLLLILNSAYGYLLAPNLTPNSPVSEFITRLLVLLGIVIISGLYTKTAGWVLIALYLSSFWIFNFVDVIDHLEYVGLGLYLAIAGSGRLSVNQDLKDESVASYQRASRFMQIFSGLAIISAAFSEKLIGMDLAQNFLNSHNWNIMASVNIDDRLFIILVGLTELLIGLSFVLGWAMRASTLALLTVMLITAGLLGPEEVTGHLFAIALILSVWVHPVDTKHQAK